MNNKRDRDVPALLGVEALTTVKGKKKKKKKHSKIISNVFQPLRNICLFSKQISSSDKKFTL